MRNKRHRPGPMAQNQRHTMPQRKTGTFNHVFSRVSGDAMSNVESLTVNHDGCIVIPAAVVDQLDLAPGQSVDVVSDEKQLRLSRPEVHAYADWRHISHGLLDDQEK